MTVEPVVLGQKYRDTITGFEGTATGRFEYLFGCVRVNLEKGKDGEAKDCCVDEQRLVLAETGEAPLATARSGGDRPAPPARPS
jgi:hypothetical protein